MIARFLNPKLMIAAVVLLSVCGVTWYVVSSINRYAELSAQVERYTGEMKELKREVRDRDEVILQIKKAQSVVQETIKENEHVRRFNDDILDRIEASNEEHDGSVSPVLRNTLDALGGLRN